MKRLLALLVAAGLCGAAPAAEPSSRPAPDEPRLVLPTTIEKLWYRAGGKRRQGDLTIGEDGLEFVTQRKAFAVPLDRIQFVSYGKMGGDVDTDWVLLSVGVTHPYDRVGLRDGRRWGYGGRTRELYDTLRSALEQLSAGQYRVAPGYKVYEVPNRACTLAIPDNWNSYLESVVLVGGRSPWGTTVLSEQPIRRVVREPDGTARPVDDLELLDSILAGESPGFFIERSRSGRGMGCGGFSAGARERVLARAREDPAFGRGFEMTEPPVATDATVGGCAALRIVGRSRKAGGAELVLELYAAARGETLYLFGLRALDDRYARLREVFAASVATVRFGAEAPR